ncbi:MAG: bifunctional hydroxymethylpyrimidine kinase/phosphomethylpyrimidine kinase [Candidatus Dadabacteria bacterium RIFCSPHIGHO2_12_FULL_53_21]|nr:MAG: bifunctional hydroxymethylpyrimidine kinase/phosphomethylpyrimidine kinase [Candidatus Dadabacteria bacterium RIFCSPHIGHO2_12_FULL_53_21]
MGRKVPRALTIAGSDSGGGAGIQADLKTFTAFRVFGMSVITSVTAQNTLSVLGVSDLPGEFVELQMDAVLSDIGADAVKTGMLSNKEIVSSVSKKLREYGIKNLVVDPVMVSKGGDTLLDAGAREAMVSELFKLALIVTPNIPEAEEITASKISSLSGMKQAAEAIKSLGPEYVLVKGGHLENLPDAIDVFYDGHSHYELKAPRIDTKNTHGTGCTYSAAVCAALAAGFSPLDAVKEAKDYVTYAIMRSFDLGKGHGPLNHFWKFE